MKTLSILGDSISTFAGWNPEGNEIYYPVDDVDAVEKTWWSIVLEKTGLVLGINQSYSGSRVSVSGLRPAWSCMLSERRLSILKGDVILLFGGINDCCQDAELPSYETFEESYDLLLQKLKRSNPESAIFCMDLYPFPSWKSDKKNYRGWSPDDLNKAIWKCADKNNIEVIPLHTFDSSDDYSLFIDGTVHPSAKGMEKLGSFVSSFLIDHGIAN